VTFDRAEYQQTVAALQSGVADLRHHIIELPHAVNAALGGMVVAAAREALVWCADQLVTVASEVLDTILELLRGIAAPVLFFERAYRWQGLRGTVTGVAGALNPALLPATGTWHGPAATAYTRATKPQVDATTKIGTIADKVHLALVTSAGTGVAFYIALGLILAKVIAAVVAAIAAFGTAVLSPVGVAIILEEITITPAMIAAAVTAAVTALAVQAGQLSVLHGEAVDAGTFPGGRWPDAVTDSYADGTVSDGDADWSLRR
jgi:hypothetical protein